MKIKHYVIFGLATLVVGILLGTSVSADQPEPGSEDDPLVTKSYVDNYLNNAVAGLQKEVDSLKAQVAELESKIGSGTPVQKEQITLQIGNKTAFIGTREVQLDIAPYMEKDTTMIPFAFVGQALGAEVKWVNETKTVIFQSGSQTIELKIGSKTAHVNGSPVDLGTPPVIKSNRTLVPLRFVSVNLGAKVQWIKETQNIIITP